ncbi:MAG: STAS domain-containing protein [Eubacteriales bacterium]
MLDIKHVYSDRKSIVTMVGELGIDTITYFNEQMALVNSYCPQELVIDFAGMAFMDSTGVRALMEIMKEAADRKQIISLVNIDEQVYEVLDLIGIIKIFGPQKFFKKQS